MNRALFLCVVTLATGLTATELAAPALAWAPITSSSPVWRPPVPYSLNQNGSADLGFAMTEAEVQRGMDDWARVSCTSLTTNYRGSTSAQAGSYEGTSTIGWYESGWRHDSSAIGVTGPRWGSYIIEADMEMNGVNFTWTTAAGSFSNVNAYSIILHEGGHYYGLGHSNVRGASMWPSYGGGVIGLAADDQNGICSLYPGSGSDCTTTGCPSGQECVSGSCQAVVGDGTVCSTCTRSSDCGGSSDLCIGYPDGAGYCGRSCGSDGDCGGDSCVPTSAGNQCVRFVGGGASCDGGTTPGCTRDSDCDSDELCSAGACVPRPTAGAAIGEACTGDSDCQSSLCIGGMCTQSCDWTNVTGSCPASFYCDADIATSCDRGYCIRGAAGAGVLGAACTGDTECASLHCDSGRCSQVCIPGGAVGCPSNYACQVGTLPCRGSCQQSGAAGDGCEVNGDCTSGICAARADAENFCTQLCGEGAACPDRFTCTLVGGETSVCVPDAGGLGTLCEDNADCLSDICALEATRTYCTRLCDDTTPCPGADYECAEVDPTTSVCRPSAMAITPVDDGGCGCRTAGSGGGGGLPLSLLALVGLGWLARRRRGLRQG